MRRTILQSRHIFFTEAPTFITHHLPSQITHFLYHPILETLGSKMTEQIVKINSIYTKGRNFKPFLYNNPENHLSNFNPTKKDNVSLHYLSFFA